MDKIILIIVVIILFIVLYFFSKPKKAVRTQAQTKSQIIQNYKDKLDKELHIYVQNDKKLLQERTKLVKLIASELNRNVFFDENEVRSIIQELISYEIKGK